MTFAEFKARYGGYLIESEWHQHANGGGWVHKSATAAEVAYIGVYALVFGGTIEGGTIEGGTIWGGTIRGGTILGGTILGGTILGGTIRGGTIWGGTIEGGTIWGGEWKTTPLFIAFSMHPLTHSAPGEIAIGCQRHSIDWWLENVEKCAADHGYSPEQQAEYRRLVEFAAHEIRLREKAWGWDKPAELTTASDGSQAEEGSTRGQNQEDQPASQG